MTKTFSKIKLKYLLNSPLMYGANSAPEDYKDEMPRYIRITDILSPTHLKDMKVGLSLYDARAYMLRDKDILFARSGATVGKTFIYSEEKYGECCFAGYLIKASVNKKMVLPEWVSYWTQSSIYLKDIELSQSQATIQNVSAEKYANFFVPITSIEKQKEIVDFLKQKDTHINKIVENYTKMLQELSASRNALMAQLITKGLDSNVPMRDSGIEWLGAVPTHWKKMKTKYVCHIKTGTEDTQDSIPNGQYPFFVRSDKIESINKYTHETEAVFTAGDGAGVGKVFHHYIGKFSAHQRVYIFTDFSNVTGRFFYYFLSSFLASDVLRGNAKSTVDSLRKPMLENFIIAFPQIEEQKKIVENLDIKVKELNTLESKLLNQINMLNEYRAVLITSVVTGQIDITKFSQQT